MPVLAARSPAQISTQGECRRYPPTLAYGGYGGDDPDVIEHSTYPATFDDEWCGEFRPQSSAEPSISLNAANVLRVLFESNGEKPEGWWWRVPPGPKTDETET
jgi:hypothetical protein